MAQRFRVRGVPILVAVVLRWKVWGPLAHTIEEREHSIKAAIEQAKTEREQAEKLLAEQQKAIQEANLGQAKVALTRAQKLNPQKLISDADF